MDALNNLNVIVSIFAGLIAIGTAIWGVARYLQKKVISSQMRQISQPLPSKQSSHQVEHKLLSKLDWMEVLWYGLEDSFKARDGGGVMVSGAIGFTALFIMGMSSAPVIAFVVFFTLFILVNLVFYTYFVGRRVEEKIEDIDGKVLQKTNGQRSR